jgi:O-antigen ligase
MTSARFGPPLTRIPALLGALAIGVFAALSLSINSATRFYQWPWFFYWQVVLIAPIAILAGRLLVSRRPVRFGRWLDCGLVLLAAANVCAALFSPFRPQSLNLALIPVAAICLAYLGLDWIARDAAERARRTVFVATTVGTLMFLFVVVSACLWLFADVLPGWLGGRPLAAVLRIRNEEPFGHSLYTAGAAVLSAPWLAALGLTGSRRMRWIWLSAAALAVALVSTSSSRGGVLALVAMLACTAALWLAGSPLARRHRLLVVAGALLSAIAVASLEPRLRGLVLRGQWSSLATESNRQHSAMLQAGWLMGRSRPFIGYGPGTVSRVYPHYREQLAGGTDDVLQLHDLPAQSWGELGAAGVAALLLLLTGVARLARDNWRLRGSPAVLPADRLRAQAAAVAFAGYAVMCLFDYQLDVPWFAAMAAVLLVLLRVSSAEPVSTTGISTAPPTSARLAGGLLLAGLAILVWPTAIDLRARQLFAGAADARQAGDDAAFVAGAEQAAAMSPREPFYRTQLAAFFGEQYLRARNAADRDRARDRCCEELRRALAIDPDQDYCHFNLGWILLPQDPAEAEKHFRASARLSPYRGGVYLGVGLSLLGRNDDAAATAFALEWLNDPHTLGSPLWDGTPLSAQRARAAEALQRLAARWLDQDTLPEADRERIRYVAALADWWLGRSADTTTLVRCGSPAQQHFFLNLDSIERHSYAPRNSGAPEPWESLYLAWSRQSVPASLDADRPAFAAALRRRIDECRSSFIQLLTRPTAPDAGLLRLGRNERTGYSVLMRNQDGFVVSDLYVYPENLLVERHLSFLFPEKGCLPDRLLLAALSDLPIAPQ